VYRECTDDEANLLFFCSAINYATLAVLLSEFFTAVDERVVNLYGFGICLANDVIDTRKASRRLT
jgi:hypothetical protein